MQNDGKLFDLAVAIARYTRCAKWHSGDAKAAFDCVARAAIDALPEIAGLTNEIECLKRENERLKISISAKRG